MQPSFSLMFLFFLLITFWLHFLLEVINHNYFDHLKWSLILNRCKCVLNPHIIDINSQLCSLLKHLIALSDCNLYEIIKNILKQSKKIHHSEPCYKIIGLFINANFNHFIYKVKKLSYFPMQTCKTCLHSLIFSHAQFPAALRFMRQYY